MSENLPSCFYWKNRHHPVLCAGFSAANAAIEDQRKLLAKTITNQKEREQKLKEWMAEKTLKFRQERNLIHEPRINEEGICRDAFINLAAGTEARYRVPVVYCEGWKQGETRLSTDELDELAKKLVSIEVPGVELRPPGLMEEFHLSFPKYAVPARTV